MLSALSCGGGWLQAKKKRQEWREIEGERVFLCNGRARGRWSAVAFGIGIDGWSAEEAERLESYPSWSAPDNSLMMQAFEWYAPDDRGHWRRLSRALPALSSLGVDRLWLPPGCKAMSPSGSGYDVYDLYDLGEFDQKGSIATKWGTKAELQSLASRASELGIGLLWDAVLNHRAGADAAERCCAVRVDPHGVFGLLCCSPKLVDTERHRAQQHSVGPRADHGLGQI